MSNTKLQQDFELVRDHCINITWSYNTYIDLYCEENHALLLQVAGTFFDELEMVLRRDWMLQVSKLMDPAKTRGHESENLTIRLINEQLIEKQLMTTEIESIGSSILSYGAKLVPARNKRLAHYDRKSQLDGSVLGATSKQELEQFLRNIQEYCDLVGNAIGTGSSDFTSGACVGDVFDLIKVLKRGA